jgi:hypothetical protein
LKTVAKPGISGANGPAPPKTTVGAANAYSSTPPRRHVLDLGIGQRIQIDDDLRPSSGAAERPASFGVQKSTIRATRRNP